MQRFSLTQLSVMLSQHRLLKAPPPAIPFHLKRVGRSNKTPAFYENFSQVIQASNWDVMPPSYSVNKDQNLEISCDFLGRNSHGRGRVAPHISYF